MQRGFDITSDNVTVNDEQWTVFEHGRRQVGIDPASGIWLKESGSEPWRCVAKEYSMSGAFLAVDFLTKA